MDGITAFEESEQYFLKLQQKAAKKYSQKIQEAYTKAHDLYRELLGKDKSNY